ncbi:hypothetical protein DPMN_110292 [Dreissena polymorpha]|uniref:Uncharacterized protein n=1 Tax=Dreissena polymorpha TaxID=45954 RepID=A0A9D4KC48_DREPO|nr:hypothetical protein DPMN_110292 [Dreissena polymorpha]
MKSVIYRQKLQIYALNNERTYRCVTTSAQRFDWNQHSWYVRLEIGCVAISN